MAMKSLSLDWLKDLHSLDISHLDGLSDEDKQSVLADVSQICCNLLLDLGVEWKPQPSDDELRRQTIDWIKYEIEPNLGPANKAFLLSTDVGVTYTERVFEGLDLETKIAMVKYVTIAIYLDDLIDKEESIAAQAESFLFQMISGSPIKSGFLEEYQKVSVNLASHMSDPLVGNMLLHSCTTFVEGCVLEYRNNQKDEIFFSVGNTHIKDLRDTNENIITNSGRRWPKWLREKSAVAETFAITSFRAPNGIDLPARLWLAALPEMRTLIMYVNDVLSFPKELLADDFASHLAIITKERRWIGMPGSAPDGGWCLRDSFAEVYGSIISAGSRINRLLEPNPKARYKSDGSTNSVADLCNMLKYDDETTSKEDLMKALSMVLWETHQKGYAAWHFQTPRYRLHSLFGWVAAMIGNENLGPGWLALHFPLLLKK